MKILIGLLGTAAFLALSTGAWAHDPGYFPSDFCGTNIAGLCLQEVPARPDHWTASGPQDLDRRDPKHEPNPAQ